MSARSTTTSPETVVNPQAAAQKAHDGLFPPGPDGKPAATRTFRNEKGQVTLGNPGGPGNPYARQMAHFRRKLQSYYTEDQLQEAHQALFELVKKGNVAATRLFYEYGPGKSVKSEDPDRMDAHEWQQAKETVVKSAEVAQVMGAPNMEAHLRMTRLFRPLVTEQHLTKWGTFFRDGPPPEPPVPDISILDRPAPFPEGPIGDALRANIQGPHVPKPRRKPAPNRRRGDNGSTGPVGQAFQPDSGRALDEGQRCQAGKPDLRGGDNGSIGLDPSQVSLFGTNPAPNGSKCPKHARTR